MPAETKGVKLTEGQAVALRWASHDFPSHWGGKIMGSPSKASVNALLRRGFVQRVGVRSMDLYQATDLGRSALAAHEGGQDSHGEG